MSARSSSSRVMTTGLPQRSTVGTNVLARNPSCFLARQKGDDIGNILRLSEALEGRALFCDLAGSLRRETMVEIGVRRAGRDDVADDAALAEFLRCRERKLLKRALGPGIHQGVVIADSR